MSTTRTFFFDDKTNQNIETLKKTFHASSKSAIIRKALALLFIAKDFMDEKYVIIINDKKNKIRVQLM